MFLTPVFATHPTPPGVYLVKAIPTTGLLASVTTKLPILGGVHSERSRATAHASAHPRLNLFPLFQLSTVDCQLSPLEYRIGVQPNDRPASIGPLQNGDAA